jgi:hypothetical protein
MDWEAEMPNTNSNTAKWIAIVIAAVSLTFAAVTGGITAGLSSRVRETERDLRKIDVILEKISSMEKAITRIESDMKDLSKD